MCEVVRMRISTVKCEAKVLSENSRLLIFGEWLLSFARSYLWVFFVSNGKIEREMSRQSRVASFYCRHCDGLV